MICHGEPSVIVPSDGGGTREKKYCPNQNNVPDPIDLSLREDAEVRTADWYKIENGKVLIKVLQKKFF